MFASLLILIFVQIINARITVPPVQKFYSCPKTMANYALQAFRVKLKCQSQSSCQYSKHCPNGYSCCQQSNGCFSCVGN
jgi:hypothetical protein